MQSYQRFYCIGHTDFNTSGTNGPHLLSQAKVGTHSALPTGSHTRAHTAKQVAFWVGVVSLPSERFTRFGNPAWPGGRTANFAAFGTWSGALPENAESLRDSDAHDARRCSEASLLRGVAAPLGCVIFFCFCQNCGLHTMCSVLSACARRGVVSPLLVCSACCRNSRPPLVKTTNLPFSEIG